MALSNEDKGDVKRAMGKAMANKVSKVTRDSYEKKREEHKNAGPFKSALDAIKSPTFSAMHNERKALAKSKALQGKKYIPHGTRLKDGTTQDNRDSFAKLLDQHKADRQRFR